MDEITSVFIQEAREQLAEMESGLLRFEQTPDDADNINAIFRAAHTVKGGAGVVECDFIVDFTHLVENLLDSLRNGELAVTAPLATLLLECCDQMASLVDVLAAGAAQPAAKLQADGDALTLRLQQFIAADHGTAGSKLAVADAVEVESSGGSVVNTDSWHISVRFGRDVLRGGTDPPGFNSYGRKCLNLLEAVLKIATTAR